MTPTSLNFLFLLLVDMTAQDKVTGRLWGQIWLKAEAVLSLPAGTGASLVEWTGIGTTTQFYGPVLTSPDAKRGAVICVHFDNIPWARDKGNSQEINSALAPVLSPLSATWGCWVMPQAAGRAHLFDLIIPTVDLTHHNGLFFKENESQIVSLAAMENKCYPQNGC